MNLEHGKGHVATEAQYRAGLVTGTIPPPAPILTRHLKTDQKERLGMIGYRNYHSGFFWRLGELTAESLSEQERKAFVIMILMSTNS